MNRNQSSGNVPPASALSQTKSQPRWQSRTLLSAALRLQKALTFLPSAHNLGATLHGNGSNPQLCLQGSGRPGSNPSTAPPSPSFEGTSLSLGFVIWEVQLMIPNLQDNFAHLHTTPLTPISRRKSDDCISPAPVQLECTWQLTKLLRKCFLISQHQVLCRFFF